MRALCSCASLFWSTRYRDEDGEEKEMRDGEKVHSVLTRALKVILLKKERLDGRMNSFQMGAQCMEPIVQVELLIDILTVMYSFYSDGCNQVLSLSPSFHKSTEFNADISLYISVVIH